MRAAEDKDATSPTRTQVVVCFVPGFAVFGSGAFVGYSSLLGFLHVSWWLVAAGVIGMVLGLGLILGGGFGGMEARSKEHAEEQPPSQP